MSHNFRFLLSIDWGKLNEEKSREFLNDLYKSDFSWVLKPHIIIGESRGIGILDSNIDGVESFFMGTRSNINYSIQTIKDSESYNSMMFKAKDWGEEENHLKFLSEISK